VTSWPEHVDEVLGGDMTAGLAYVTPAGGTVVTAVAPVGLRDREAGKVSFTTSLGFGRKLDRIRREPRVALAYHARKHGFSDRPEYVLVQGRAEPIMDPGPDFRDLLERQSTRFLGPPRKGPVWDRLLREYYEIRIPVEVAVERILVWRDLRCAGEPEVLGTPAPAGEPPEQTPPKKGAGPRVDPVRAAKRLRRLPHVLLGYVQSDGYPAVVPVEVQDAGERGLELVAADRVLPNGGRRAAICGHSYRPKMIGLRSRTHTGWLEVRDGQALYAPHSEYGFVAPPNKTLLLVVNGLLAKRGVRKARREGKLPAAGA
jgi:hypothetical protein